MAERYNAPYQKYQILEEPVSGYISTDYYNLANRGISKKYLKHVLKQAKLSVDEFIKILPISIDTYKRKTAFNSTVSEKVLEVEEVYRKGTAAFGDSFYTWMSTTNVALGNVKPKELLINSFGIRMLLDEIGRMEHGILA